MLCQPICFRTETRNGSPDGRLQQALERKTFRYAHLQDSQVSLRAIKSSTNNIEDHALLKATKSATKQNATATECRKKSNTIKTARVSKRKPALKGPVQGGQRTHHALQSEGAHCGVVFRFIARLQHLEKQLARLVAPRA